MCALVALLLCATGSAWGDTETFNYSSYKGNGTSGSGSSYTMTGTDFTITNTKFYCGSSASYAQFYASGVTTITPVNGATVTKVVLTATGSSYNGYQSSGSVTTSTGSVTKTNDTTVTWSGSTTTAFTISNNKQIRWTSIVITYTPANVAVTGVTLNKSETTLEVGDVETLTATVAPSNATNKNISWSSSDTDVATISNGVVTAVAAGSATITVTTEDGSKTATCAVTVIAATKTAVNMTDFSATSTTIVKGNTTTTSVTNDQDGWTAAYTYSSSDTDVATVNASGVITAVAKGNATITCSLNVSGSDPDYKAGTTTSKTVDITVTNPFHNVTFSSNGSTYSGPTSVEEGESITLPAEDPGEVNGYTFQGWKSGTISGTTDDEPEYISSPVMGDADVTYYAVFAEEETSYSESETEKTQTLQYDTWTYGGTTSDQSTYRLFGNTGYVESTAFDLSLLKKVIVYGGTYGGDSNNSFTIGDGTNTWKSGTVTGKSATGTNEVTGGTALSGTKKLYVTSTCGNASSTGVRISKVEIFTKKRTTTCSNYCTTVTALPKPVISMEDVAMTWGDDDKYVEPSATVGEDAYDGSFGYTVDKAGLTVASDGKLTSSTPGTYVVTASIAATEDYQAASTTCTVTVGKQNVTLDFANATVRKKTSDASYTQTATATPAAYDGTIAYSKESSSTSAGATVNSSTGAVSFSATGSVIVKATAPATDKYNTAETTYTILIQTDPTIVVEDASIAYGETYTVGDDLIEGGDITVTSSNAAVATVDGLVITGIAVGTTTITVATAESDTYVAGEETFTLTVTAPTGASEKPSADPVSVFYESFNDCAGTGEEGSFSGTGTDALQTDNTGWTTTSANAANKCAKFGSGSKVGSATTPSITVTNGTVYTLTFKAAPWSTETTKMSVSVTGGTITGISDSNMTTQKWNNYTGTITANSTSLTITFGPSGNNRFFLDEVKITRPATPVTSTSVTTTGGIATYCYQYPLNLDGIEGAKAYKVSEVDTEKEKLMLTQISGSIKGGVPFILKADGDDDTFEIPLADESTTVPAGNLLVGTLAPTFVEQVVEGNTNFAYSKSYECFVKLGAAGNTVPANRAYLPINLGSGSSVKTFAFDFEDLPTGLNDVRSKMEDVSGEIFNLAGQKMNRLQKGINIVNGKKILVK